MRRRRVANLLALGVLGTLVERPMHPYEMASVMRSRSKDVDLSIKWGSLYTVIRNLERHHLVEAVATERQGSRPERTVYRITAAGRDELRDWLTEIVARPEIERPRFVAGLSMLTALNPDEALALLQARIATLEAGTAEQRRAMEATRLEVPRLYLLEREYLLALREAELGWLRGIVDEFASGSLPGLKVWRRALAEAPPSGSQGDRQ